MIKDGIKRYFKCCKYMLIPFGTLFLGLIIGLSVFVPVAGAAFKDLFDKAATLLIDVHADTGSLFDFLSDSVKALDWSNPAQAALTLISPEWLEETLKGATLALFGGEVFIGDLGLQINTAAEEATAELQKGFAALIIFAVIGIIAGYYILKFQVRKEIASRALWKVILVTTADFLLVIALSAVSVWLAGLWKYSLIFSFVFVLFAVGGVSLTEAFLAQGLNKVKFKEVFTGKNILLLILCNFILFLLWAALTVVITAVLNGIAGLIIGLTLLEFTSIVIGLNAEAFVKNFAEARV